MSRFFRSASSSSSSASETAVSEDEDDFLTASQLITRGEEPSRRIPTDTAVNLATNSTTNHRDLLLHALLEERCHRQARDELGQRASAERVRRLAETQYQSLSSRLAAYGVIEASYDTSSYAAQRQAVRDGLDRLHSSTRSQQRRPELITQAGEEMQHLSIGVDTLQLFRPQVERPRLAEVPSLGLADMLSRLQAPSLVASSPALLDGTRYHREFEEVGTLGRGGYGIVYHCKHRFDGLSYAVKKIPLSTSRLQRIRDRGQAEVDRLLLELTTLARLDHPNIVRYYGGWVEFTSFDQASMTYDSDAIFGASNHTVNTETSRSWRETDLGEGDDFITFEESTTTSKGSSTQDNALHRLSTQETQATVSDADVESINRSLSPEHSTLSTFTQDATPCLALHIQMSLYPFSLADYLSSAVVAQHKHCFHLEPSLRILSALVDGIVYLHAQGIVHRDLKPANVFLAHDPHKHGWCRLCSRPEKTCIDGVRVRIGDFGLVAALTSRELDDYTVPVGTELYRPLDGTDRSCLEALDWFALGIIAFELLWPFSTRMERHETLSALKSGLYPHTFDQRFSEHTGDVAKLIESLLREQAVIDDIRTTIATILTTC